MGEGLSGQTVREQKMALLGSPISHKSSFNHCSTEWYPSIVEKVVPALPSCPMAEPSSCSRITLYCVWSLIAWWIAMHGKRFIILLAERTILCLFYLSWPYPLRFLFFAVSRYDTWWLRQYDWQLEKKYAWLLCCWWCDNDAVASALYKDDLLVNVCTLWWR